MSLKISRNLRPRRFNPWPVLLLSAVLGACAFIGIVGSTAAQIAINRPPTGTLQVAVISTHTPTPTPTITPTPDYTQLAIASASPTPPGTPTPIPTATVPPPPTGWFVAPVNPTALPTPILPAAAELPTSCDGPGRLNILVIGVDGRGSNFAGRSDSIMVVGINFADKSAQILSLPRDLWVQIPEYNGNALHENRVNTAFPIGGAPLLADTLSANFGLRIDRYVVVNFTTFTTAIDAIGGIDIYVDRAIYDPAYPNGPGNTLLLEIPAGWVHMDGEVALMYARTRHQDSDFARMRRQQSIILAARDKLLQPETLAALPALIALGYQSVQTNLSFEEAALLGCVGPQISDAALSRIVIDQTMTFPERRDSGAQVLLPNMDAILPQLVIFNSGE